MCLEGVCLLQDLRKSLASRNRNDIIIWSWNNPFNGSNANFSAALTSAAAVNQIFDNNIYPFYKSKSVSGHTCAYIFTYDEVFVCIMPLFGNYEVVMSLRAFSIKVGIPTDLQFDRAVEQKGPHSDFQCAIREFRIEWRNSEPCST